MNVADKIKDKIIKHAAEGAIASVAILLVWVANKLAPIVLPLIENNLSNQVLLALLLASIAINILLVILIYSVTKKSPLKLKYGIYWDSEKNPYCPSCQKPIAGYNEYIYQKGYYCKPCDKVFPLTDVSGNDIAPADVVKQL